MQALVRQLNKIYSREPALHLDCDSSGFQWIDGTDSAHSVVSFIRANGDELVICAFNFTPVPREDYWLGVPESGEWLEIFNSDDRAFGGSHQVNGNLMSCPGPAHGRAEHISLTLPPLGAVFMKWSPAAVET
jgi:1,4-alpha-glucan branching enzyme